MKKHTLAFMFVGHTLALCSTAPAQESRAYRAILDASYPSSFDDAALLDRMPSALASVEATPLAEVLVDRWIRIASKPEASPSRWKALAAALDSRALHGLARFRLRAALSAHSRELGDIEAGNRQSPASEFLTHALAIGPFGDSGNLFHDVVYAPEFEELSIDATWPGRFGDVAFRGVQRRPGGFQLDLAPRGAGVRGQGCQYGLFQLSTPEAIGCYVQVSCSGSFEAWSNGRRVASVNRALERQPVRVFCPIVLQKGWNRLLFKTTAASQSTVSLRLCDAQGTAIDGVSEETERKIHPRTSPVDDDTQLVPKAFETARSWLMKRTARGSPVLLALAGNLESRLAKPDVGLDLARQAFAAAPDDLQVRAAYYEGWRLARHIPRDLVRIETRRLLEVENIDEHRHLFLRRVRRLYDDDKKEEALQILGKRIASNPDETPTRELYFNLLDRLGWTGDAQRALDELLARVPRSTRYLLRKVRYIERSGDPARALGLVKRALADRPGNPALVSAAISLARKTGQTALTSELVELRHRLDPRSPAAQRERARTLADLGKMLEAAALLEGLIRSRPRDATLLSDIAELYELAGKREIALAFYRRSLALEPGQHGLRAWIGRLTGEKDFPECDPYRLDALAAVASYEPRPEDRGASSTLILDQMVIRVYADGSLMEETHQLRRLNDQDGIARHEEAEQAASADELLEIRTILPDGTWYAPHRVAGTFSMPKLRPGAFIEERYRNYKPSPAADAIDFVSFYFQSLDEPFRMSRLVVLLPKGHRLGSFVRRRFASVDMSEQDLGELVAYVFVKKDMPRLRVERGMPSPREVLPWVTFGANIDPRAYLRERRVALDAITQPLLEIRKKTAEVCAGLADDAAKAKAIHRFVHDLTPDPRRRAGSPQPLSVLLKGEGDRFFLQLSMLKAAGIAWVPALIHPIPPEMDAEPDPLFGDPRFYSHPAALARPRGSEPFWIVDGAPRHSPFASRPTRVGGAPLGGSPYLLLEGQYGVPGRMPRAELAELASIEINAKLALDGRDARLDAIVRFPGDGGWINREAVKSQTRDVHRLIARQLSGQFFPGFALESHEMQGIDTDGEPLVMRVRMRRRGLLTKHGDQLSLTVPMPPTRLTQRFGGRGARYYPFVVRNYSVSSWELNIDPGKHAVRRLPDGVFVRQAILDYALSYARDRGRIVVRRTMTIIPGKIAPGAYDEFVARCRSVDSAESARIILEPGD